MMVKLKKTDVSCVSSLWCFYPDEKHSEFGLFCFELIRDVFCISSILNARNYVFAIWRLLLN